MSFEQADRQAFRGPDESGDMPGLAVECIVFDQADRPKRRFLLPLAGLLTPLSGGISAIAADARG